MEIKENTNKSKKVMSGFRGGAKKKVMYVNQLHRMPFYNKETEEFDYYSFVENLRDNLTFADGYKWACIIHDLDTENGRKKTPHLHLIVQNNSSSGISGRLLKSTLQDNNDNNFEFLKGQFKASELYIIHDTDAAQAAGKHLYDEHSVIANYDYVSEIQKHRKNREKAIEKKQREDYIGKILAGELIKADFQNSDDIEKARYYAINKTKIDNAFEVRSKIELNEKKAKKIGDYAEDYEKYKMDLPTNKEVYWIYGQSGTGKSLFSKLLAKLYSKKHTDIYFSSSKNDPFQDYQGEKIVVLEELRPGAISIEDLFRLFDHDEVASIKRRYHNINIEAKVFIVNSILSPAQYFAKMFDRDRSLNIENSLDLRKALSDIERIYGEPFQQLDRRITHTIQMFYSENQYAFKGYKQRKIDKQTPCITGDLLYQLIYDDVTRFEFMCDNNYKNIVNGSLRSVSKEPEKEENSDLSNDEEDGIEDEFGIFS